MLRSRGATVSQSLNHPILLLMLMSFPNSLPLFPTESWYGSLQHRRASLSLVFSRARCTTVHGFGNTISLSWFVQ